MDSKLLGALCFMLTVPLVSGLSCIQCQNTEGFGMCMKYRAFVECEGWQDRCYKASVDTWYEGDPVLLFGRGCTSASECNDKKVDVCKGGKGQDYPFDHQCDVYCCSGDYCNSASLPAVSAIILAACALLTIVLL
ncbi:uncharacterized protein LOC5512610 [Nematostella vectensis]|uniref:uncharacterized protein LOC5512610 n=1 Tax=Nematostella vectensis TaxID=45351 RepID=UPI0020775A21|nr:uncharacterized protein LOC5512610 [Nematostella vectensis]